MHEVRKRHGGTPVQRRAASGKGGKGGENTKEMTRMNKIDINDKNLKPK
jgi:hypothetical protein